MKRNFKNSYLFSLLLLVLSCDSKKIESHTQAVLHDSRDKIETQKLILEDTLIIKEGDIIFHTSTSSQSKAIQLATHSKYSHVGIIFKANNDKDYVVLEAVEPVKYTPLNEWIKRGENTHFVVKRLKNADKVMTKEVIQKMKNVGEKRIGKHYDLYFEWSDERLYCSELVWKIYKEVLTIEVGKLEKLSSFDLENEIVKYKVKERYGNKIPLNETVISPVAIFDSKELILVK